MNPHAHRVVLTGASGTLGRNFLNVVAPDPMVRVLALLREGSRELLASPQLETARVDFADSAAVRRRIEQFEPTCLIHCAATGMAFPKTRWFDLIRFNVDMSIDMCQSVAGLPGCHFIYISTGLAYRETGRPLHEDDALDTLHPYGASKAAADMLVRSAAAEFGVAVTVLRPFSFTGLWDDRSRLFPSLLRAAAEGRKVDLSPGDQHRDHCSARDIAEGIVAAIHAAPHDPTQPRIYNLGSGNPSTLRSVIRRVMNELELEINLDFGARGYAPHEPMHLVADIEKARREIGWQPRHNLAHAVWQLACESFPQLKVREPRPTLQNE